MNNRWISLSVCWHKSSHQNPSLKQNRNSSLATHHSLSRPFYSSKFIWFWCHDGMHACEGKHADLISSCPHDRKIQKAKKVKLLAWRRDTYWSNRLQTERLRRLRGSNQNAVLSSKSAVTHCASERTTVKIVESYSDIVSVNQVLSLHLYAFIYLYKYMYTQMQSICIYMYMYISMYCIHGDRASMTNFSDDH